jgi:hypothetical protein
MGASVGIGGLIVGISMLVVFSMAYQSISLQIDSGLDRLEDADEPIPTFTIDDGILFMVQSWTTPLLHLVPDTLTAH